MRTSALVMAAALVAPPTPSPDRPHEAPAQKRAEPGERVHSEGGSRTTLLIAGGAVVAFAGGVGIGSLRRRSLRRRTAAPVAVAEPGAATAEAATTPHAAPHPTEPAGPAPHAAAPGGGGAARPGA